jgi:hypothetical protein
VERQQAEKYRKGKTEILRLVAKTDPELVALDANGDPAYREAKHGQFALIVVRIDRQGSECGQV